jgi:hypothetical protein
VGSLLSTTAGDVFSFASSTGNVQKTYVTNNCVFVSCRKIVTQVSATERRLRKLFSRYGDWEEYGTPTETVTSNKVIYDSNSVTADWKTSVANELIGSNKSSAQIATSMISSINSNYGYQVRCIKEE